MTDSKKIEDGGYPKDGSTFLTETINRTTYRWAKYKPDGARQMGKPGRWQKQVWSGDWFKWENCEDPTGLICQPIEDGPISTALKAYEPHMAVLRLVVAYDDLLRGYTGPSDTLFAGDVAEIDAAYDEMVAAARKAGDPRYILRLCAALTAALAVQTRQGVEVKDWHRSDNAYGGVMLYSLREDGWRKGEPVMVNDVTIRVERAPGSETDIEPIVQRIRSALVDVPAVESEPVALIEREVLAELAKHKTATGTVFSPLFKRKFGDKVPLFAHPPRFLSNEGSEIDADLLARCKEIVEWKKTGKLPGDHLRKLGKSIEERLGGSLFIDAGLTQAELQTTDEALKLIIALSTRKGSAGDGSATITSGGRDDG